MKKLFVYITLIWFTIVSQMQLVHAFDMQKMNMAGHHTMIEIKQSIFCETSNETKKTECTKELIPDKLLFQSNNEELFENFTFILPVSFNISEDISDESLLPNFSHSPPDLFFEKTKYASLIGIIKNVN